MLPKKEMTVASHKTSNSKSPSTAFQRSKNLSAGGPQFAFRWFLEVCEGLRPGYDGQSKSKILYGQAVPAFLVNVSHVLFSFALESKYSLTSQGVHFERKPTPGH